MDKVTKKRFAHVQLSKKQATRDPYNWLRTKKLTNEQRNKHRMNERTHNRSKNKQVNYDFTFVSCTVANEGAS